MKTVIIKKGWFFGGGYVYGWTKINPQIHPHAVGINMVILKNNPKIRVIVNEIEYLLNSLTALKFIQQYRAVKTIGNKRIGIISKSILEPYVKEGRTF